MSAAVQDSAQGGMLGVMVAAFGLFGWLQACGPGIRVFRGAGVPDAGPVHTDEGTCSEHGAHDGSLNS